MNLTQEQQQALDEYRTLAGKRWKEQLMADWMRGGSNLYRGEWAYLQQVRNAFGAKIFTEMDNGDTDN
jgi:hypothetical protein